MIAIVDYGVGNLFSLSSSLKKIGAEVVVSGDKEVIESADKIILPGVGAFRDAIKKLTESGLKEVVISECEKGKPLLGICLGMQMLFDESYEDGKYEGLHLIPGSVRPISEVIPKSYKVPHIGWNRLDIKKPSKLLEFIQDGDYVYFVHSFYAADCENYIVSMSEYGYPITASVENKNVYGCQFHPEKSGKVGLNILKGFISL